MRVEFSEFSFGYAFAENLIKSSASSVSGAPYFPNLVDEGRLGYDVKLKFGVQALFFQYKLPEYMIRSTAKEISKYGLHTKGLPIPFFRLSLMRKGVSDQHKLLIKLEEKYPGCVFYVAPTMVSQKEFNKAYSNTEVHKSTLLFSPQDIGPLPDFKQHSVAFHHAPCCAWFCSEPAKLEVQTVASVAEDRMRKEETLSLVHHVASIARVVNEIVFSDNAVQARALSELGRRRIREVRRQMVNRDVSIELDFEQESAIEELLVTRELARIALGLDLLLVQRRD